MGNFKYTNDQFAEFALLILNFDMEKVEFFKKGFSEDEWKLILKGIVIDCQKILDFSSSHSDIQKAEVIKDFADFFHLRMFRPQMRKILVSDNGKKTLFKPPKIISAVDIKKDIIKENNYSLSFEELFKSNDFANLFIDILTNSFEKPFLNKNKEYIGNNQGIFGLMFDLFDREGYLNQTKPIEKIQALNTSFPNLTLDESVLRKHYKTIEKGDFKNIISRKLSQFSRKGKSGS